MMRQLGILGVAGFVAATCLLATTGFSADEDNPRKRRAASDRAQQREGARQRPGVQGQRGGGALALLSKVDLTDDQKARIQAIQKDIAEQQQEWAKANEDKIAELREAYGKLRKGGERPDREAIQALMKKREAVMKDRPDNSDSIKKILDVLTAEQKDDLLIALLSGQGQRGRAAAGGRGGAGGSRPGAARPGGDQARRRRPGADN